MPITGPDFFIVGAPKCGTTAMCTYLNQHPDIFISDPKEPHFFGSDLKYVPYTRDIQEYLRLFEAGQGKLCGEGSVFYLFSKEAAKEIYAFNPNAKIIIMVRNPIDLMHSLHSEMLLAGDEHIVDFAQALQAEPARTKGDCIKPGTKHPEGLFYTAVATLSPQIEHLFAVFGHEKVHIIVYDDLRNNAATVYADTLRFLEVVPTFQTTFDVIRANRNVTSKHLNLLLRHPPTHLRVIIKTFIPFSIRQIIRQTLLRMNTRQGKRAAIDAELYQQLQQQFASEIDRLGTLIGRDLSHWSNL
jgi:hypothetical protein